VSIETGGHALGFRGANTCADLAAGAFLATGALPASDRYCARNPGRVRGATTVGGLLDR
jgi:hypothetical protein